MPVLVVVIIMVIAAGMLLLQVGRATVLASDAQTAADAAALAGARNLSQQILAADGSFAGVDEAQVRAAARDYAERNAADVLDVQISGCGVTATVRTNQALDGKQAREVGAAGQRAEATSTAQLGAPGGIGLAGVSPVPVNGAVPAPERAAARLAAHFGLQVTATTGGEHVANSFHYRGLAIDVSNGSGPTPQMAAFFRAAERAFAGHILELFYDPEGGVKYNQRIPPIGGHSDHVHIAIAPDGGAGGASPADLGAADLGSGGGGAATVGGGAATVGGGSATGGDGSVRLVPPGGAATGGCTGSGGVSLAGFGGGSFQPSASSEQIARAVCAVGRRFGADSFVMLAAFETGIDESGMRNLPGGDRDSAGVFQQRPTQGWGTYAEVTDVYHAAASFFARAKANERPGSGQTPGQLAQSVQNSGTPLAYDPLEGAARDLMQRVGCTGAKVGSQV